MKHSYDLQVVQLARRNTAVLLIICNKSMVAPTTVSTATHLERLALLGAAVCTNLRLQYSKRLLEGNFLALQLMIAYDQLEGVSFLQNTEDTLSAQA